MPFVPILMLVIGLTLLIVAITTLLAIRSSTRRCTRQTKGRFQEFVEFHNKRTSYFFPRIRYEANGKVYEGEAQHFEGFGIYKKPTKGARVTVWYNPDDPQKYWASMPGLLVQSNVMRVLLCAGALLCVAGAALLAH